MDTEEGCLMIHADIVHDLKRALKQILEISYSGHPDGREARLEVISRMAQEALKKAGVEI
jgi:hypothetical protein